LEKLRDGKFRQAAIFKIEILTIITKISFKDVVSGFHLVLKMKERL